MFGRFFSQRFGNLRTRTRNWIERRNLTTRSYSILQYSVFGISTTALLALFGPSITTFAEQNPPIKAKLCEELGRETIAATRWLAFKQITYKDNKGVERKWDLIERPTRSSHGIDAVDVLCVVKKMEKKIKYYWCYNIDLLSLICVLNFRRVW